MEKCFHKYAFMQIRCKNKRFLLAISGGPDSLALAALARAYNLEKKAKFYFSDIEDKLQMSKIFKQTKN